MYFDIEVIYLDFFVVHFHFHQFQYNTTNTFSENYLNSKMQVSKSWLIQVG